MEKNLLLKQIQTDLSELCEKVNHRHVGSPGNQKATKYTSVRMASAGFSVLMPEFDCIDWDVGNIKLKAGDSELSAFVSPYSLSCSVDSYFVTAGSLDELKNKDFSGKIAVLFGELTREQLFPKNFVFYNPEEHQQIVRLLEEKKPLAIIAITTRNPEAAGALYPFPLIEDGDFDIPSAYLTEEEGEKLLGQPDALLHLAIQSERVPSKGCNVIGLQRGQTQKRIVVSAHIDTKKDTPGALDDGTGIAVLLALGELLREYSGKYGVELVAFNGEDYYAASGQMLYLEHASRDFGQILMNINIDGAGCKYSKTSYCTVGSEGKIEEIIEGMFGNNKEFVRIEPWVQGDHMIFAMNNIPAVAIASEDPYAVSAEITHTPKDTLENVDITKVYEIALAVKHLIDKVNDIL